MQRKYVRSALSGMAILVVIIAASLTPSHLFAQGEDNPTGVTGVYSGNVTTGCSYDPYTENAHREVDDIVVPGCVGAYPLKWTRYNNSRHDGPGFGGWTFSYSYFVDSAGGWHLPDGRVINWDSDAFNGGLEYSYSYGGPQTLFMPDGGKVIIGSTTQVIDPYGLVTTIEYDSHNRISQVTEPGGRYLQINWDHPAGDIWANSVILSVYAFSGPAGDPNDHPTQWVNYSWGNVPWQYTSFPALMNVQYSDGTGATYNYVMTGGQTSPRVSLLTADDARYNGPMRQIAYELPGGGRGGISQEKKLSGEVVSTIAMGANNTIRIETRGDGPTIQRTFTYGNRPNGMTNEASGKLINYTDFQGHLTRLTYNAGDSHIPSFGFINSVTDANNHTTTYTRQANSWGIKRITHHDGSHIDQTYWPNNSESSPYFLASRTDELGRTTTYTRDSNNRITRKDYASDSQTPASYETFEYNSLAQITKHRLKNGAYQHFQYSSDNRGLLLAKWNPTFNTTPLDSDPKTTYTYYSADDVPAWTDRVKTETDPRGNPTTYEYDYGFDTNGNSTSTPAASRGLVTKITHTDNTYQLFAYSKYGDKMWAENENRERTRYTYDDYGRLLTVKNPLLKTVVTNDYTAPSGTSFYTHTTSSVNTTTSVTGVVVKNNYDANWRKTSVTNGYGSSNPSTTTFVYDQYGSITSIGNLVAVTDPNNHTTTTDYDVRDRKWHVTDALGHQTTFGYDDASNIRSITRPDLSVETKTYDALNRLKTDTVPKDGPPTSPTEFIITTFVYNPSGSLYSVKDAKDQTTTFDYDPSDLKTKMTYPNGTDYQSWTYDPAKNLIARRTVNSISQLFSYDSRNRQFAMAWSNGADWANFTYDAASRMTTAENPTSTITHGYDPAGRLTLDRQRLRILPVSAVSRKTHGTGAMAIDFDVALPLVGTAGVECRVGQGANADQHRIVVTFPRAVTFTGASFTSGTGTVASTSTSTDGKTVTINLTGVTNAQTITVTLNGVNDGITTNNINLGIGVLLGDTTGNGFVNSADVSQTQSQSGQPVTSSNFREDVTANGYINSPDVSVVQVQSGTSLARVPPLSQPLPSSPDIDVQYAYDDDSTEKQLYVTSAGYNLTYGYDEQRRFKTIANTGGATLFTYGYDAASNEVSRTNESTHVKQDYGTPDALNRMMQRDVQSNNGAVLSHEAYGYDPQRPGLLTSVTRQEQSQTQTQDLFSYDLTGELTNAQYTVPSGGSAARTADYTWDKAGNRTRLTDSVAGIYNYGVNNLNQYTTDGTSGGAITPGSEHELLNYQNVNYTYINDTHLSSVSGMDINGGQSTYQLSYDALGRCVARVLTGSTSSTTYYIYDVEKPILEYHSWSSPSAANVYGRGIDEILMRTDYSPNRTIYYQDDHEGSVTHLTDSSGAVIESYKYDAFGKPTINGGALTASAFGNRFMFTGREYVSQFGVYEYRNRAYHPGLGRFMSEDPKGFAAGDNNFFRYCGNDPVDRTDPMGLSDLSLDAQQGIDQSGAHQGGASQQIAKAQVAIQVYVGAHNIEAIARADAARGAAENTQKPETVPVSVRTVIEKGYEAGTKSVQTVSITQNGTMTVSAPQTGTTKVPFGIGTVPVPGVFHPKQQVKGSYPIYRISMKGTAVAAPLLIFGHRYAINYDLKVKVDFSNHTASVSGRHDGYPSYHVTVGEKEVYYFQERSFGDLKPPMDVNVNSAPTGW
jgi:RHS repeat-associated protein